MPRHIKPQPIEKALAFLHTNDDTPSLYQNILDCMSIRGLASVAQVITLTGQSDATVRRVLDELTHETPLHPALLHKDSVAWGRRRPPVVYLLNETGAEVLRQTSGNKNIKPPSFQEPSELLDAYLEMDVLRVARQNGFAADAEVVLPFKGGNANIRADVLVTIQGQKTLFEIERQANAHNRHRITLKLLHLVEFFRAPEANGVDRAIRLLFVISDDDAQTLDEWEKALAQVELQIGKLPFHLHTCQAQNFLVHPVWDSLQNFMPLEPAIESDAAEKNTQTTEPANEWLKELRVPSSDLDEMNVIIPALSASFDRSATGFEQAETSRQRCLSFFELVRFIYQASFFEKSPTRLYATPPIESIYLLRRYLHAHQNSSLLKELQETLNWAQKQRSGVTNYRDALTHVLWDVFLRWHGFYRGGPLIVSICPPNFEDMRRSDYYIYVRIENWEMYNREKPRFRNYNREGLLEEQALAWILEALYLHGAELGLIEKLWKLPLTINTKGKRK
jgi:hypothetical protein